MLRMAASPKRSTFERLKVGNSEGSDDIGHNGIEFAKKSEKSKGQKLAKSWKSKGEKSKKMSKSGNSPNFNATEAGLSFLTPDARIAFNCLWLAFTKAPILWHFDLKCHI